MDCFTSPRLRSFEKKVREVIILFTVDAAAAASSREQIAVVKWQDPFRKIAGLWRERYTREAYFIP